MMKSVIDGSMISPAQCRAARALLGWTQQDLAEAAEIGNATIRNFESGKSLPQSATLRVLAQALQSARVEFIADERGEGVVKLSQNDSY